MRVAKWRSGVVEWLMNVVVRVWQSGGQVRENDGCVWEPRDGIINGKLGMLVYVKWGVDMYWERGTGM